MTEVPGIFVRGRKERVSGEVARGPGFGGKPSLCLRMHGALLVVLCAGCSHSKRVEPLTIANPTLGAVTIAVAPALNVSGSMDFDPNRFADQMASELGYAERITVIPVSRVLGAMAVLGVSEVGTPDLAVELAELVGADAILVFAVTEYDAYVPPRVGITAQIIGVEPRPEPRNGTRTVEHHRGQLLAESQRFFNGANADVVGEIKSFAALRDGDESPYGWRRYVVSQQHFMRFCCHATIQSLLSRQGSKVATAGT